MPLNYFPLEIIQLKLKAVSAPLVLMNCISIPIPNEFVIYDF